jgi:hypothetical protein
MMIASTTSPTLDLEQLIRKIFLNRKITRQDQHLLMSLQFKSCLTAKEENWIHELHCALSQGKLRVAD